MGAAAADGAPGHGLVAGAVALVALRAALALAMGAVPFHHPAFHLAIHLGAALVLALRPGIPTLLVLGVLSGIVLRMVDRSGWRRLGRCEGSGCEKDVHFITP